MKYKLFSFEYLKSRKALYVLIGLLLFAGVLAPIYSKLYWRNVENKIENIYKIKVAVFDITVTGDTIREVLAIKDLKYKDSLIAMHVRRVNGIPDVANIPFTYLEGYNFPLKEFTKDGLLAKVIFANYKKPKFYEEYYVARKSIHIVK